MWHRWTNRTLLVFLLGLSAAANASLELVSRIDGTPELVNGPNGATSNPATSVDGRFIAFQSSAGNQVDVDANGPIQDIFVYDRATDTTELLTAGADAPSSRPSMSALGRFVAFESNASNLVVGDGNNSTDIFVYDRDTDTIELLTTGGNADSVNAAISSDGRFVTFESEASNLVPGDINNARDVFVYDRNTGTTESITFGGNASSFNPAINNSGRFIAFASLADNLTDGIFLNTANLFLYDRDTNSTLFVSQGITVQNGLPSISGDGRFIAYEGRDANLVGQQPFTIPGIYVFDRNINRSEFITETGDNDSRDPSISGDGRFVVFESIASNLAAGDSNGSGRDIFVYDRNTSSTELLTAGSNGSNQDPVISADGNFVTFETFADNLIPGDVNNTLDVLVVERATITRERIPSDLVQEVNGGNANSVAPSVSANGQFVAFQSTAENLVDGDANGHNDIFVYNRVTGANEILTLGGDNASFGASISADGRIVAFLSSASNITSADTNTFTDVFVHDRDTGISVILTPGANDDSLQPSISADGRFVAFASRASNLVANDTNDNTDIFVYDRQTDTTELLTEGGNGASRDSSISADGRFVAFNSEASNLSAGDTNGNISDVFVYDRQTKTLELLTSGGNNVSLFPSISADGQLVAFASRASNLVNTDFNGDDTDVFVFDRELGSIRHLTSGANESSFSPSISGDGRLVAFGSRANNLVSGDLNNSDEVFVFELATNSLRLLVPGANGRTGDPSVSGDGRAIAFISPATNLGDDGTVSFTDIFLSVVNGAPTADSLVTSTDEDSPLALTLTGFDPDSDSLAFTIETGPTNGVLSGVAPNIVYSPSQNFVGTDSFTFTTNDGGESSTPATVSIDVNSVNDAPVAIGSGGTPLITSEDTSLAIALEGSDVDGDALSFTIVTGPSNGRLLGAVPNLIFLPDPNFSGSDQFSFTVSDGVLTSAAQTIDLTVTPINDGPSAVSQTLTTSFGTSLAITLSGADVDNDPLNFIVVELPASGDLSGTPPNLLYTPISGFFGADSFSFTVDDGALTSTTATIAIEVSEAIAPSPPTNNVPVADSQSVLTPRDAPVTLLLRGSDSDNDSLSFNFISLPENGALRGVPPNLTYTPDTNFIGSDGFAFTVSDDESTSEPATVSITVADGTISLLSAVLPASRSVEVNTTATAFATLINAGTVDAQGCRLDLPDSVSGEFFFQTSDADSNELVGEQNAAVNIPAGASQSFVFGITPTEAVSALEVALNFECANAESAASFAGLNTLLLAASTTPVADLIALAATTTNNGVMELANNSGFFTAATINVGSSAMISVSADTGNATLPMTLSVCQTDPLTSVCINPTVPGTEPVVLEVTEGDSPTFAVFANSSDSIALDPANSRVFIRFSDELGEIRGATSVAVQNTP